MQSKTGFIIKFIIGMLIIEVYYFVNYFTEISFIQECYVISQEMNITASVVPDFWITLNVQRELYNNPTRTVFGNNSFQVSKSMIQASQDLSVAVM